MSKQLTADFIVELIKLCLVDTKSLEICKKYLKYHYLYTDVQKKVVKQIFESHEVTSTLPTIGTLGQMFQTDQEAISLLNKIKRTVIERDQYSDILGMFETFIVDSRFRVLYEKIGDLYNEGKQKQAVELLEKESKEIAAFKLKDNYYTTVFGGFQERNQKREVTKDSILLEKLTFGIHELDDITRGGFNKGTSALILANSGVGKSTFLRWVGLCNARLGRRVIHFQAEGTEQECLDAYDAGWTGMGLHDIEFGNIPEQKRVKILKAQRDILSNGGEIFVYASESFDSMTIDNCKEIVKDIWSIHGQVDLVIFDYLEIFTLKGQFGNSEAGERKRREDVANKMTNIAIEFKCGVITATQSNNIPPDRLNNENFVLTRDNISEFKGALKPFSYFFTLNATQDEYEAEIIRIYTDKLRKYKRPKDVTRIYQSRSNGRFYDSRKTLKEFYQQH